MEGYNAPPVSTWTMLAAGIVDPAKVTPLGCRKRRLHLPAWCSPPSASWLDMPDKKEAKPSRRGGMGGDFDY